MRAFFVLTLLALAPVAYGQSKGGSMLGKYTLEITPLVGLNLPYDIWGVAGTLRTFGVQAAYSVSDDGALTASALYHAKDNDWAWTADAGYRHEINSALFHAYFDVGLHYSKFNLKSDPDENGVCEPASCRTDSGTYIGVYGGSGLVIPFSSMSLARVGFRFYNNPQAWVLISAGLGLRY